MHTIERKRDGFRDRTLGMSTPEDKFKSEHNYVQNNYVTRAVLHPLAIELFGAEQKPLWSTTGSKQIRSYFRDTLSYFIGVGGGIAPRWGGAALLILYELRGIFAAL